MPRHINKLIKEIEGCVELSDEHMDHCQGLLHDQFPKIGGFQAMSVMAAARRSIIGTPDNIFIQLLHIRERHHWICVSNSDSTCRPGEVAAYDSLLQPQPKATNFMTMQLASLLYHSGPTITVRWANVSQQVNNLDCGVHAIAVATSLCYGIMPETCTWETATFRQHLADCIRTSKLTPFPFRCQREKIPDIL